MPRLSALLLAAVLVAAAGGANAAALDGMRFNVQFSADGKTQDKDVIVFDAGKAACPGIANQFQFTPAAYTSERSGESMTFAFTLSSAKHGAVAVTGSIARNGAVSGTRTWSKPDKDPIAHTFTGAVEAQPQAKKPY